MAGRILTLQRQARELGRLRTGYTDTSGPKPRPVRSSTWIVTSHSEDYVAAAAEVWGGRVEKWQPLGNRPQQYRVITEVSCLDAILPPGDPLSQHYETWTKGGVQRRCDGMTETISDQPCVCRAQWGDAFWETAPRDAASHCKVTTRLNVILPEMPDIGAWRVETHSFYSANEIAAAVDVLKGSIGDQALIPVRLRIEQRTRVAGGQTKHFPVVAVELRGATAGQVLSGAVRVAVTGAGVPMAAVGGGGEGQAAIEGPRPAPAPAAEDFIAAAKAAKDLDELSAALQAAQQAGFARHLLDESDPVAVAFMARRAQLTQPSTPAAAERPTPQPAAPAAAAQAEAAPSAPSSDPAEADLLWQQIVAAWPGTISALRERFLQENGGVAPEHASEQELDAFLRRVRAGDLNQPASAPAPDEVPF